MLEDLDCWFRYSITFFWNTVESFLDLMRLGGSYTYINMHNRQRWVHFKYRSRNLPSYLHVPPTQKWKLAIRPTPLKYWYARSTVRETLTFYKEQGKNHFFYVRICRSRVSFNSALKGVIEYIRRVSDIKREWSTPGRVRKWCWISWIYLYWNMYMDESEDISFTIIQLGQFPPMVCKKGTSFWPTGTNKGQLSGITVLFSSFILHYF